MGKSKLSCKDRYGTGVRVGEGFGFEFWLGEDCGSVWVSGWGRG